MTTLFKKYFHICKKVLAETVFAQNFHIRKVGKITAFCAVGIIWLNEIRLKWESNEGSASDIFGNSTGKHPSPILGQYSLF